MKYALLSVLVVSLVSIMIIPNVLGQEPTIPAWIKNNAGWWADGQIDDSAFTTGIQFMIKENIISIPYLSEQDTQKMELKDQKKAMGLERNEKVPAWVKNNAGWWADGLISDDDFVSGIQYLIKVGTINVEQQERKDHKSESENVVSRQIKAPINLALPIIVEDIGGGSDFISPFGPIRHSRDSGHGHGGIDIPLDTGDSIFAVADGVIITNDFAEDNRGGNIVYLLIKPGDREGEGWIFMYEHIILKPGIDVDSQVKRGQLIGTTAMTYGNNHLQLSYIFENYKFHKNQICWVDQLEPADKSSLEERFDEIRNSQEFIELWENAKEEGYYNYRGLLDKENFSDGPQLCYPLGIDVRIPVN